MRIGFVGCGRHATTSLYPALRPAGLELVATCANRLANAERTARWFGAEQAYDDVGEMLSRDDLDGVVIVTPSSAYRDLAVQALDAGLPVFTEKPGATSTDDLEAIEQAARSAELPAMVGYMKRFGRAYRAAKRFVDEDRFGRVTNVHVKFLVGPGHFPTLRSYLFDNPVHAIDLLRFFGGDIADIESRSLTLAAESHSLSVLVQFESGAVGTAQLGTTGSFSQENELLEVVGEGHSVTVANVDTVVCRSPQGPARVDRPTYTVPLKENLTGDVMGFVPELQHFKAVVLEGAACESDITSAKKTLQVIEWIWSQVGD